MRSNPHIAIHSAVRSIDAHNALGYFRNAGLESPEAAAQQEGEKAMAARLVLLLLLL